MISIQKLPPAHTHTHIRIETRTNFHSCPLPPAPCRASIFDMFLQRWMIVTVLSNLFFISPFWCHVKKNDEKKMSIHTHKSSTMPCKCRNTNTIVNTLFAFIFFFFCVACVPFNFVVGRSLQRFCHHSSSSSAV